MNVQDIISVLNFTAFLPEPDDPSESWRKRFPNKRTAVLSLGRSSLSWSALQRNGRPGPVTTLRGEPKDLLAQAALPIRDATDNGWCTVLMNTRYVISLETNLSRRPGSEDLIKTSPRSVLGARFERGKRYAVTHNPETNSSVLLTCDEEYIRKTESMIREAGLSIGRISCGTYCLLRQAIGQTNITKGSEKPLSVLFVVCCLGSVCVLVQDQDRWLELRSRTDVYEDGLEPVIELLAPFRERVAPESEVVVLCDSSQPALEDGLRDLFPGRKFTSLTQPDVLWGLTAQY